MIPGHVCSRRATKPSMRHVAHPLCGAAQQEPGKCRSCRAPDNYQVGSNYCCLVQDLIVGNADPHVGRTGCTCSRRNSSGLAVEQPGKESRAKRVARADGVDFRSRVTRAKAAFRTISVPGPLVAGLQDDLRRPEREQFVQHRFALRKPGEDFAFRQAGNQAVFSRVGPAFRAAPACC